MLDVRARCFNLSVRHLSALVGGPAGGPSVRTVVLEWRSRDFADKARRGSCRGVARAHKGWPFHEQRCHLDAAPAGFKGLRAAWPSCKERQRLRDEDKMSKCRPVQAVQVLKKETKARVYSKMSTSAGDDVSPAHRLPRVGNPGPGKRKKTNYGEGPCLTIR